MSTSSSELVAIARLNGDFRKNYGILIGAILYLRSLSAAGGRPYLWRGLLFAVVSAAFAWLEGHGLAWLRAI
jgi:hypothetical protein